MRDRLGLPHVELGEIAGQEALFDEEVVVPVPTLERIVSWFSEVGGPAGRLTLPDRQVSARHRVAGRPGVSERPLEIGSSRLFGMLSESEDGSAPSVPTVVFLNVGLIPHHGPGRLWVELARACAASGNVRSLRFDLNGLGDSPTREGGSELRNFPVGALEDLRDIHRAVTADGSDLIVMGVCSGADHAIELGLAEPVAAICVINPALSFLQWGRSDGTAPSETPASDERQTWGRSGPLLSRAMASLSRYRSMVRWVPTPGWWVVKRWLMKETPVDTLEHLVQSGADVLLMLGSGEFAPDLPRGAASSRRPRRPRGCLSGDRPPPGPFTVGAVQPRPCRWSCSVPTWPAGPPPSPRCPICPRVVRGEITPRENPSTGGDPGPSIGAAAPSCGKEGST